MPPAGATRYLRNEQTLSKKGRMRYWIWMKTGCKANKLEDARGDEGEGRDKASNEPTFPNRTAKRKKCHLWWLLLLPPSMEASSNGDNTGRKMMTRKRREESYCPGIFCNRTALEGGRGRQEAQGRRSDLGSRRRRWRKEEEKRGKKFLASLHL